VLAEWGRWCVFLSQFVRGYFTRQRFRVGGTAFYSTRLPLADDPVVDLDYPPELPVNLEPVTDVGQPVQAVEKYRPVVKPDGVASGAVADAADAETP